MDQASIKALKQTIAGLTLTETTTEYTLDEETGKLKIVKQKIQEKMLPPNVDLMKMLYQQIVEPKNNFEELSDEELEKEKQRLLKELKEGANVGGKNKCKNKV